MVDLTQRSQRRKGRRGKIKYKHDYISALFERVMTREKTFPDKLNSLLVVEIWMVDDFGTGCC